MAYYMIAGAAILLLCIGFSKLLYRFGVPSLLIFIVLGMLAGSDGIGGIYFDDYALAQTLSSVALTSSCFSAGSVPIGRLPSRWPPPLYYFPPLVLL